METPVRAILSLYVATTVLVTFNQLIFDKLGQLASLLYPR